MKQVQRIRIAPGLRKHELKAKSDLRRHKDQEKRATLAAEIAAMKYSAGPSLLSDRERAQIKERVRSARKGAW